MVRCCELVVCWVVGLGVWWLGVECRVVRIFDVVNVKFQFEVFLNFRTSFEF